MYGVNNIKSVVNHPMNPIIPRLNINGMYSITPNLPQGMRINENGLITGTPTVVSPLTSYTITVKHNNGNITTNVVSIEGILIILNSNIYIK